MAISRSASVWTAGTSTPVTAGGRPRQHRNRRAVRREFTHRLRETQGILAPGVNWSATSRFSFLGPELAPGQLAEKRAEQLLRRHGVVTKRSIELDNLGWEWRPIYAALQLMELRGSVRRGYFVEGLPGVQFANADFVDLMRSIGAHPDPERPSVVTATDPAYVFDRKLASVALSPASNLLALTRNASTRVVFLGGRPIMVSYSDGASIETDGAPDGEIELALCSLVKSISETSSTKRVLISRWNGETVVESGAAEMLANVGFRRDYPNMVFDALSAATAGR